MGGCGGGGEGPGCSLAGLVDIEPREDNSFLAYI